MSSILNSISSGDLLVQEVPRDIPVKKDSISELLLNSEIEFEIPEFNEKQDSNPIFEEELNYVIPELRIDEKQNSIADLLENSEIELTTCPKLENKLDDINTGFGHQNDLHYEDPCKLRTLKVPLYKENYFSEFFTEEEKAAARHALGLYNKGDIVAMSMLTAEDHPPTILEIKDTSIKSLRKGDKFFSPAVVTSSIYYSDGTTLNDTLLSINKFIDKHEQDINKINKLSGESNITSLGDVRVFLFGFTNQQTLKQTIDNISQEMLRFENTGLIKS